jgi:hypothetical protein
VLSADGQSSGTGQAMVGAPAQAAESVIAHGSVLEDDDRAATQTARSHHPLRLRRLLGRILGSHA